MSQDISIALLQEDIGFALNSDSEFANINVQLERKELYSSEVALATVWQTVKGGASGIGVVVAMPKVNVQAPNGPLEFVCRQRLTVLEEPNINQTPGTGTQEFAEDVGTYLLRLLHEYSLAQDITLYANGEAMIPNRDYAGIRGVDVDLFYKFSPAQLTRCATVPIAFAGPTGDPPVYSCTLTCATMGATIYYTTDGTFPGPANGAAQVYGNPFNVAGGTQVRAAAYLNGIKGSPVWTETAPSS
ncbi:MAG TPA: chitobiase/beta-hexosaminidase C-terminal domain-containing protein [Verrucomicrobiae bacterium]|nr:chitobiase/beta-hexosaminidase C-terminal domain-containing protein [Verrucomicrobiae bacterium]